MRKLVATVIVHATLLVACRDAERSARGLDAGAAMAAAPEGGAAPDASAGAEGGSGVQMDARVGTDAGDGGEAGPGSAGDTGPRGEAGAEAGALASDLELERRGIEQAKACGFYEPNQDPDSYRVQDEFDRCLTRCWLAASCAEIGDYLCEEAENALDGCIGGCPWAPADGFRCADGSRIPHALVCNLEADCDEEEDERDCGEFRCSNGEVIPARSARCDGWDDCLDGSDERACASGC